MKKLLFYASVAFVAFSFASCTEEDTTNPVLQLVAPTSTTQTVEAGTEVTFTVNVTDDTELASIMAYNGNASIATSKVTEFTDPKSYIYTTTITINAATTIKIEATDAAGNVDAIEIVFTITTPAADLTTVAVTADNGEAIVGAGGSSFGSYIDIDGGKIYHSANVAANLAAIDAIFNQTSLYDKGTGVVNSTTLKLKKTTISAATFATATEDALTGLTADAIPEAGVAVAQGDVFYFETKAGAKGLLLIKTFTAATGDNNANMVIEIKVKA